VLEQQHGSPGALGEATLEVLHAGYPLDTHPIFSFSTMKNKLA
jgi:hypothetical protein